VARAGCIDTFDRDATRKHGSTLNDPL
jgi:hypothetical protein